MIVTGETHTHDEHRFLNANLIHLIWDGNSSLQIEGSKEGLEFAKEKQVGQLKYIRKEIAESADSWDVSSDSSAAVSNHDIFEFSKIIIKLTQKILTFFNDFNFGFEDLVSFFEECLEKALITRIHQEIPEISRLEKVERSIGVDERCKLNKLIYKELIKFIVPLVMNQLNKHLEQFNEAIEIRNVSLTRKILDIVFSSARPGIFIAGEKHVRSTYVIAQTKKFHKIMPVPFLFITPKESISIDSVKLAYSILFNGSIANNNISVTMNNVDKETNKFMDIALKNECSLQEIANTIDPQQLRNHL